MQVNVLGKIKKYEIAIKITARQSKRTNTCIRNDIKTII